MKAYIFMVLKLRCRAEGWNFMNMGKFIERAIQTADILDKNLMISNTTSIIQWIFRTGKIYCFLFLVMSIT
ncbi:MAG: alpha-E domain-containing protein [Saprospirales bacterium]|nr:alpha-E domain-containing protein [Saprospirales bacterium]